MPAKKDLEIEQGASYLFSGPYDPYNNEFEAKVIGYEPSTGHVSAVIQRDGSYERLAFQLGDAGWKVLARTSGDHAEQTGGIDASAKSGPPR